MQKRARHQRSGWNRREFLKSTGLGLGALTLGPVMGWAQSNPPIKVGVLVPLLLPVGTSATRGAFLATSEINEAGGVLGRPIRVEGLIRDDGLDPRIAPQNFESLVVQDQVLVVVGGFLDETTIPIVDSVLPRLKTPFLNTGTAGPETTDRVRNDYDNFKYYFRLMLDTDILTEDTTNAAQGVLGGELGIKRVAILAEDGGFGRDFQSFLEAKLPEVGFTSPEGNSSRFPQTGSFDYSGILNQAKSDDVGAFIVAIIRNSGVGFVNQWYNQGSRIPVLGINVSGQAFEYFANTAGQCVSHVYADAATGATAVTEKTLPFFNAYTARYTTAPAQPLFTGYTTYDSIYILKEAIERIGEAPPSPSDESAYSAYKDALVTALEETDSIGTVGRIRFQGKNDERPHNPITTDEQGNIYVVPKWVQWQKDSSGQPTRNVVWPGAFKNSEFVSPP